MRKPIIIIWDTSLLYKATYFYQLYPTENIHVYCKFLFTDHFKMGL